MPARRRTVILLRRGPAAEHGWLGVRIGLALGLAGDQVAVVLEGEGALWAAAELDAAWLGGDPRRDLAGLVADAGATLLVDESELPPGLAVRIGAEMASAQRLHDLIDAADWVIPL